jgi:GTP cyclohydrolase III
MEIKERVHTSCIYHLNFPFLFLLIQIVCCLISNFMRAYDIKAIAIFFLGFLLYFKSISNIIAKIEEIVDLKLGVGIGERKNSRNFCAPVPIKLFENML